MVVIALVAVTRKPQPTDPEVRTVGWRVLDSWTGDSSMLTGSFVSDTGLLRVRWVTTMLDVALPVSLRVTLHSAVSSRPIAVMVDSRTAGSGTASLAEGLNISYFSVESSNLHWTLAVDEGTPGFER